MKLKIITLAIILCSNNLFGESLHEAVVNGTYAEVEVLVEKYNLNINEENTIGFTPFMYAIIYFKTVIATYFLSKIKESQRPQTAFNMCLLALDQLNELYEDHTEYKIQELYAPLELIRSYIDSCSLIDDSLEKKAQEYSKHHPNSIFWNKILGWLKDKRTQEFEEDMVIV